MSTRLGACVRRARLQARFGRPIPTNTTSPSASSRAATVAIISSGVKSEAVVHSGAVLLGRLEPLLEPRLLLHVLRATLHAVHELVEVVRELGTIARDRLPPDIEIVVAVVVALRVRRMRAPWLDHHGAHDGRRNQRPIGIRWVKRFFTQLFHNDDNWRQA